MSLRAWLESCPLVAILRGVKPAEVEALGDALVTNGFRVIEVPLNSPDPYTSIAMLSKRLNARALVGAGTVMTAAQVEQVAAAGGQLIVMPHADARVLRAAKALGLIALPGFATPTEAFAMLEAGADGLKLFPAEANPPAALRAIRAVLPRETLILPVGGITALNMSEYWKASANGFGLGSALYQPGYSAAEVQTHAREFMRALKLFQSAQGASQQ